MKRRAVLPALAIAVLPLLPAATATADPVELTTVSITVSMDLPSSTRPSTGPIVYEVTDVPVGAGPELTGADLVSNPSDWGGSVTVDVDADAGTVTVATEDSNTFETADISISGPGLGELTLISDDLWAPEDVEKSATRNAPAVTRAQAGMPLVIGVTGDGVNLLSWASTVPAVYWALADGGTAVFSIAQAGPASTTTTTAAPTTTTTAPPAAAAAVTATPAFTG